MTQADFLRQLPNTITLSQGSSGQVILLPTAHEEVQAIVCSLANTHQLPLFGSALMLDLRRLMAIPSHRVEEFMITVGNRHRHERTDILPIALSTTFSITICRF